MQSYLADYSMLFGGGAGGSGSDNLLNLGQSVYGSGAVAQSKRARKMSAFMPMRGRKDGRDAQFLAAQQQQQAGDYAPSGSGEPPTSAGDLLLLPAATREADGDASIMRLVSMAAGANSPLEQRWTVPTPRDFAQQVRHMRAISGSPSIGLESADDGAFASAGDPSASVMQAKLRRAFHPMRGKKSASSGLDFVDDLADA